MKYLTLQQQIINQQTVEGKNNYFRIFLASIGNSAHLAKSYSRLGIEMQTRLRITAMNRFKYFEDLSLEGYVILSTMGEMLEDAHSNIIVNPNDDKQNFRRDRANYNRSQEKNQR